jgi:hypothetical protein
MQSSAKTSKGTRVDGDAESRPLKSSAGINKAQEPNEKDKQLRGYEAHN